MSNIQQTTGTARWNVLAIVGFILAFFTTVIGLILSIIALVQINGAARQGEMQRGKGLAIWGIIISVLSTVVSIIVVIVVSVAQVTMGH